MMRGVIKFFNEEKGFGFIASDECDEDLYFKESNVSSHLRPYRKQRVEFRPVETNRGMAAEDIYVLRYE
jgi:cold shock CspA family protein